MSSHPAAASLPSVYVAISSLANSTAPKPAPPTPESAWKAWPSQANAVKAMSAPSSPLPLSQATINLSSAPDRVRAEFLTYILNGGGQYNLERSGLLASKIWTLNSMSEFLDVSANIESPMSPPAEPLPRQPASNSLSPGSLSPTPLSFLGSPSQDPEDPDFSPPPKPGVTICATV